MKQAIKIANDSEYGLAGGIFTTNINRALNVAKAMRTGRIWINTYNQFPPVRHSVDIKIWYRS